MDEYVNELVIQHDPYPPPPASDNVFDVQPEKLEPDWYCRARHRIRRGENTGKWKYCYARSGAGTPHLGWGRCKNHGGNTPGQIDRYNALTNPTLQTLIEEYLADPDPMNLRAELAVARAIMQYEMTQHEEVQEAILAWHASFQKSRRGLHDLPLYHIKAIKAALDTGVLHAGMPEAAIQAELEEGLRRWQGRWADETGSPINLMLEKPRKTPNSLALLRGLTVIAQLVKDIAKLEEDAYLSAFAVKYALDRYGQITREALVSLMREKGVDSEEAQEILQAIVQRWDKVPLAESSVPRLAASTG